jgi:hypothetical protein
MREATNKQEPSSTEGGEMKYKAGDGVWVLCQVIEPGQEMIKVTGSGYDNWFLARKCDCRPVEPATKQPTQAQKLAERTMKAIWAANDAMNETPVTKEPLTTESNSSEIPDSSSDPVNPSHYKQGGIECIEAIKAALGEGFPDYLRGNVMKYLWRYDKKNGVEDLKKARWYLDRLIKEVGE